MTDATIHANGAPSVAHSKSRARLLAGLLPLFALADGALLVAVAVATGAAYHLFAYGQTSATGDALQIGLIIAATFVMVGLARHEYDLPSFLNPRLKVRRVAAWWTASFVSFVTLLFLTKTADAFSRGALILFYAAGFLGLAGLRHVQARLVRHGCKVGLMAARRVMLVGGDAELLAFGRRYQPWNLGVEIVGTARLDPATFGPGEAAEDRLRGDLDRAVGAARAAHPDDVYIVIPWSETRAINQALDAFVTVPAAVHLAPEHILDRFHAPRIELLGPMASLKLARKPLTGWEIGAKRALDMLGALVGLALLLPLFLTVAVAIKLDSRGPVLFVQQRRGFNQVPFRILKFRTMTTLEDGDHVRQATRGDARVTAVGRWLRRWSIDELPQLVNVLLGDMSLVGPRPHAVSHDRAFEQRVALYARRHNVKPGITGWAQINGYRGEADTDALIKGRVEHDLYYIDNWSLWLDLRILALTVFSPRTHRNAY